MKVRALISLSRIFALVPLVLLPVGAQVDGAAAEEPESYAIYSMLLRTEVRPEWKVTSWAIIQETQTFPSMGHNIRKCLSVSRDQASTYSPLIEDYLRKNRARQVLERKFDLPEYTLVGRSSGVPNPSLAASIQFEVSAVGFDKDRSRALVYVGHHCGSLCGGGSYHLLVKKSGKWQVDQEYHGMSCLWAS